MQPTSQAFLPQNNSTTYRQSYQVIILVKVFIITLAQLNQFSFEMPNLQPGGSSNENRTESHTSHTLYSESCSNYH